MTYKYQQNAEALAIPGWRPSGAQATARCPFHEDTQASLSVNVENGLWHCFGCGEKGTIAGLYSRVRGVSIEEARRIIYGQGSMPTIVKADVEKWHATLLDHDHKTRLAYLTFARGWSLDVIRNRRIGWNEGRYTIPVFEDDEVVNVFRYGPGNKAKMLPYAQGYSTGLWPLDSLQGERVYVCEGQPDTLLALSLGMPAVTMGGAMSWKDSYATMLQDKVVYLLMDADEAGQAAAEHIGASVHQHARSVHLVRFPGLPHKDGAETHKDLTDWLQRMGHTPEQLMQLVEQTPPWTPPEHPADEHQLVSALRHRYVPVGNEALELVLWSRRRRSHDRYPLDNPSKCRAALALEVGPVDLWVKANRGYSESRPADDLRMALETLAGSAKSYEHLHKVGFGIHWVDGLPVYVSRGLVATADETGTWRALEVPVLGDRLIESARAWGGWSLDELNRDPAMSLEDCYAVIGTALRAGWQWERETDALVHSLLTMACPVLGLFPRKPLIHVQAPSNSGKSKLLKGWYAGIAFEALGGGFGTPAMVETDTTVAGLISKYRDAALLLCLDEQEISEHGKVSDVLAAIRSTMDSAAGLLRGSREGSYRESSIRLPILIASIETVGQRDADGTRWLVTRLVHEDHRPDPEHFVAPIFASVDARELRRSILVGTLRRGRDLLKAAAEFGSGHQYGMEPRQFDNLRGLFAVGKLLGATVKNLAGEVRETVKSRAYEFSQYRMSFVLLEAILHSPFRHHAHGNPSTLAREIAALNEGEYVEAGAKLERMENGKTALMVNWSGVKGTILKGTKWSQMHERRLADIAAECPTYYNNGFQRRLNGIPRRMTAFLFDHDKMPEKGEGGPDEAPPPDDQSLDEPVGADTAELELGPVE